MSPIAPKFALLALASTALAVPFGEHGSKHRRQHFLPSGRPVPTGTGAPYGFGNGTGIWGPTGTGTGFVAPTGFSSAALYQSVDPVSDSADSVTTSCTDTVVYVTSTNRVTVTVRASSTADALPVEASSSSAAMGLKLRNKANAYGKWHKQSTTTTAAATSADATTSAVVSSAAATTAEASTSTTASSAAASASASASASSSTSSSGKRGVAYNDASLTTAFEDASEVTWGYNWGSSSSGLSSSFEYVPLLWGTSSAFTDGWDAAVTTALANGATHLMSFNEPDLSSQANLSPAAAAAAYKTYMQPYAGKAKLGAPAVTNGADGMGLDWLAEFITACDGCTIDFVSIHWYDSYTNTAYFQSHIEDAYTTGGGVPVWITEFGTTDGTDDEISGFLETVMPWMDEQSYVERYAYFMVSDGLLVSGTEPSTYGSTYKTYTG